MTEHNPTFRSPVAVRELTSSGSVVTSELTLIDLTGVQITLIQGEAGDILQQHLSKIPAKPGDLVELAEGFVARLTPTEFYLFGKSASAKLPSAADLDDGFTKAKRFAHATDFTHGKAVLKLSGAAAPEALLKVCGLDFHETAFPNMQVKQTSAAKIKTLVARCDENDTYTFLLHADRPFGQYLWDILSDAGQEFGIVVG
jgi:heterotetrameric sarcosine oxidase gamma subunit